ncbi:hybrid sensor histidine kinase/response regulator [Thermohalobacter berrensis]|uniref:histidine kinase n=1 Tax=Thermohalobacter berrensis TaxID=99594 RepID=A0A419T459_9FIRM|nr:hybrid sensor histidine kinase/response regulator [Thermohalobacter berrensis]RKD32347.1 hypothetical protein BET03_03300 [Thermohalobacter berrensis]
MLSGSKEGREFLDNSGQIVKCQQDGDYYSIAACFNRKLKLIKELIEKVPYKKDCKEFLDYSIAKVINNIGADYGYIVTINDDFTIDFISKYKLPDELLNKLKSSVFSKELLKKRIKKGTIKLVTKSDLCVSEKHILHKLFLQYKIKSLVEVPIKERDNTIKGFLVLVSQKDENIFQEHIYLLQILTSIILVLLKDHRKHEKRQKELVKAERLKILGELAGGVAHDFNNVLTTIIGFTQMALLKSRNEEIRKLLDIIYKSSLDAKAIVNKIQNFNKTSYDKQIDLHNLNSIVENVIEMAKPKWKNDYESKGAKLEIIKRLNSKRCIYCNEHEIREALLNIVLNAMDAMENGGKLTIITYDKDDKAYLHIEDNGIGMEDKVKEKIFEPYYSTKEARGTGLGLSITQNIINEYNGNISVESKLGSGTKFIISFPSYSKVDNIKEENMEIPKYDSVKTLIIDDREDVADTIKELLAMLNVESDIGSTREEIFRKITQKEYDIVICDLAMPDISGLDVAKEIKEEYPNIKFILMTGWPGDIEKDKLVNVGYMIHKPCTLKDLIKGIEKVVE